MCDNFDSEKDKTAHYVRLRAQGMSHWAAMYVSDINVNTAMLIEREFRDSGFKEDFFEEKRGRLTND
jgi:hypothetical protein